MNKLELLQEWEKKIKVTDEVLGQFNDLFGGYSGKATEAFCELQDAYTSAISQLVGDAEKWLEWYWQDNAMGVNGFEAGSEEQYQPITNLEQLLELIEGGKNAT